VPDDDITAELDAAMEDMRQAQERLYRAHTPYHEARWNRRVANGKAIRITTPDATRC
jgi:hypothetical protein